MRTYEKNTYFGLGDFGRERSTTEDWTNFLSSINFDKKVVPFDRIPAIKATVIRQRSRDPLKA